MKRLTVLLSLAMVLVAAPLCAQSQEGSAEIPSFSKHSLGGQIGAPVLSAGISWKARPTEHFAVQTDFSIGFEELNLTTYIPGFDYMIMRPTPNEYALQHLFWGGSLFVFSLNTNFVYQSRDFNNFEIFIGAGPQISYNLMSSVRFGGSVIFGFDYHCPKIPLDVSLDIRPTLLCGLPEYPYIGRRDDTFSNYLITTMPLTISLRRRF